MKKKLMCREVKEGTEEGAFQVVSRDYKDPKAIN